MKVNKSKEIDPETIIDYFTKILSNNQDYYHIVNTVNDKITIPYYEFKSCISYKKEHAGLEYLTKRYSELLIEAMNRKQKDDILHVLAYCAFYESDKKSKDKPKDGEIYFHDEDLQAYCEKYLDIKVDGRIYLVFEPSDGFLFITPTYGQRTVVDYDATYVNKKIVKIDLKDDRLCHTILEAAGIAVMDTRKVRFYIEK